MSNQAYSRTVFFGTSHFAVQTFQALLDAGVRPLFVVTTPDRPQGRHLQLTPPPAKVWAAAHEIEVLQPERLKEPPFSAELTSKASDGTFDVFIVASYGKLIPADLLTLPTYGVINIHPSLLPRYRGASPVQSVILADDRATGVSIMKMDAEMDHGPLLAQKEITTVTWPLTTVELKTLLAQEGAKLLLEVLPTYLAGALTPTPQNHAQATYTKKFGKEDGLLNLSADGYQNYLRFCALKETPGVYFFDTNRGTPVRVKIADASFSDGTFILTRVVPEGRKEMDFEAYMRGKRI